MVSPTRVALRVLAGDWAGAWIAVGAGMGTMLGLAALVAATDYRRTDLLADTLTYVAMAAGGEFRTDGGEVTIGLRPLLLTFAGYGLMAYLLVRRSRRDAATLGQVGALARRVAVVNAWALFMLALIGSGVGPRIDLISTLVFGTATLAVALLVAVVVGLPGVFVGWAQRYQALMAGPLKAMLFLVAVACPVTLVAALRISPYEDQSLSIVLAYLPNLAAFGLLLGMGVPASAFNIFAVLGDSPLAMSSSPTIFDLISDDARFWLWPAIAIALLVATGIYSAYHSPADATGRRLGWPLAVILPVTLLVVETSGQLSIAAADARGVIGLPLARLGFEPLLVVSFGAVYGLAAGVLGSVLVGRRVAMPVAPADPS